MRTSLVLQWASLGASNAGGECSIPGWGTKIPHAGQCGQRAGGKEEMKQMGKMATPGLSWQVYHASRKTMSTTVSRHGVGPRWFEEQQMAATLADPGHLLSQ